MRNIFFYELPHLITSWLKRNSLIHDVSEIPAYIPKYKCKKTCFSYRLNLNVTIDGFVGENVLPGECCPSVQPKHFKCSH